MRMLLAALAVIWAVLGVAHATDRNPLDARFIVNAGWFLVSTDTRVRVDGATSDLVGSDISFEDTFNMGDIDRFRAEGAWRIEKRHVLRAMYFQNNRSATKMIDRDVSFSGETFPTHANVIAESGFTVAQLSYDYAVAHGRNHQVAIGLGVHYLDVDLRLRSTIDAQGTDLSDSIEGDATTSAPLPVLGIRAVWRFAPHFYIAGQVQYFYVEFEPYSGNLLDIKASLVWQFSDHVGVGLGYDDFGLRFDMDEAGRFNGHLGWNYGGAIVYLSVMF